VWAGSAIFAQGKLKNAISMQKNEMTELVADCGKAKAGKTLFLSILII